MSRWRQRFTEKKEEGMALVIAIILLSALEILGFALITMSEIDYSVANNISRSEEAVYGAEQGVMIGIDAVLNNSDMNSLAAGATVGIHSYTYRGEGTYSANDLSEPYPRWNAVVKALGEAPPETVLTLKFYRYQIESTGIGLRGVTRRIRAEILAFKPVTGGLQAVRETTRTDVTRKLAATTSAIK